MDVVKLIKALLHENGATNLQDSGNDPTGEFDLLRRVSFNLDGRVYQIEIGRARNHGGVSE